MTLLLRYYRWHRVRPFRKRDRFGRPMMANAKSSIASARAELQYGASLMDARDRDDAEINGGPSS